MKQNTKYFVAMAMIIALAGFGATKGIMLNASYAQAHDGGSDNSGGSGEMEQEEGDINQSLDDEEHGLQTLQAPEINPSQLVTYGDALPLLKDMQTTLSGIQTNTSTNALQSDPKLSDAEKALLAQLTTKHQTDFSNLDARIADLNTQIQKLIDLLTPISTQPISDAAGIRDLLVAELKDFSDQTQKLVNFGNLDVQMINDETD